MPRIRVELPDRFHFLTRIPVRIYDVNYGGHIGNDSLLRLLQEARMHYLAQWGYTELEVAGVGLIMSDVGVEFKGESHYGDIWDIRMLVTDFTRVGFDWYYQVDAGPKRIAVAKTGMVCFDYERKRPVQVPEKFVRQVAALPGL